ncbi:MAG: N-acetyl-gamma-glutamyl-phosphate reductase [Balneola sp.]
MIKVGIIGGAGYTAGELIRILINHPRTELTSVVSKSHSGQKIHEAHPDLIGEIGLVFEEQLNHELDVVFLCSGHGKSKGIIESGVIPEKTKIIDLSSDFRLKSEGNEFVYGLPELNRDLIKEAKRVANPGCFATCIQLCLLPLASANLLNNDVHVSAITGSTGAGQSPTSTTHFSWRNNNASVYKAFTHQHLGEITQNVTHLQNDSVGAINFIPFRGAFTRGILAACYLKTELSLEEAVVLFKDNYNSHSFVHISEKAVDVKQVVNSNKGVLHLQKEGDQLLITGAIDNLLKGASGQAVQNMNLMFGLEETTGLKLKGSAF